MKNLYLYICIALCGFTAFAQNENNHWQLGAADVNFSTNPASVTTASGVSNHGYASISDDNGNLLFYTSGSKVWNKNHQMMPNGDFTANTEMVESAIIVPHPGDGNKFYIFFNLDYVTSGINPMLDYRGKYRVATVDFTNNSLGEVLIADASPLEYIDKSSTNLYYNTVEELVHDIEYGPITSAKDASGTGYWIIVQHNDNMLSYKVDSSGFNPVPVISSFEGLYYGYVYENNYGNKAGKMRMSFDYATGMMKLFNLEYSIQSKATSDPLSFNGQFYSLDFNNSTGQFSNYQHITSSPVSGAYQGFEISNDFKKVYFVNAKNINPTFPGTTDGEVRVLDLTTNTNRVLYQYSSPTTISSDFFDIQKDRYGNLLLSGKPSASNRDKYLHKIDNPDSYSGSSVRVNYISLNNTSVNTLPQLIPQISFACGGSVTLTSPEVKSDYTYRSSDIITAGTNYVVNSGANITFYAENAIYLEPNTDIKNGAVFIADIQDCPQARPMAAVADAAYTETETVVTKGIMLYPNPSADATTISLASGTIGSLTVTSIEGLTMFSGKINKESYLLNINSYRKGIYIVTIQDTEGNLFTEKLIKE